MAAGDATNPVRLSPLSRVGGTADAMVSNSTVRKGVWVRIPHPALGCQRACRCRCAHSVAHDPHPIRRRVVAARWRVGRGHVRRSARRVTESRSRRSGAGDSLYQRRGLPRGQTHTRGRCPRCDDARLDASAYAELLGWYLGDGYISASGRRGVYACTSSTTQQYSTHQRATSLTLMRRVKPGGRPHVRDCQAASSTTVEVEALAVPVPAARARAQARATDRARAVAAGDRRRASRPTSCAGCSTPTGAARTTGRRRVGGRRAEALRLPALAVHQQLRRHPATLLRRPRPARHPVAAVELEDHLGVHAARASPARRADRAQGADGQRGVR